MKKIEEVLVVYDDENETERWEEKQKMRKVATEKLLEFYEFFC